MLCKYFQTIFWRFFMDVFALSWWTIVSVFDESLLMYLFDEFCILD
jgi:hypothetical protein